MTLPTDTAAERRQALRDRLLVAALPHVVFDGWGLAALTNGAGDLGLDIGMVHAAFPNPSRDLVHHFSDWADRRMLASLEDTELAAMKVRERITLAVRARLEAFAGHEEAVRRLAGHVAISGQATVAARAVYRTVDTIWRAAGDDSVDFNFYTKRGLLAGVLGATTLYWLDDASDDHRDTWAFLDRRIAGIMRIPKLQARLRSLGDKVVSPLRHRWPGATGA